jgi:LysR family transcriptional regulator, hydrogen peroxide-inducible genes activator
MELHQIRYFLALCEELNFTRAAERCTVAQSSLTRAIKALEQELGGALFHRERANTHLSELGQKVRPFLEQAYGHVEGAKRQAQDFLRLQTTSLRLGLMSTIAPAQLTELIATLRTRHPGIALQVSDGGAQPLQERLLGGKLDVAIYALPGLASDDRLNHLPLYREPFVAVVPDGHHLARREAVRIQDIADEPNLWRLHCADADAIEAAFARHNKGPTVFTSERDGWILAMVAAGLGYAVMPAGSAPYPGVAALRLIDPEIVREIALVTPRGRPDAPAVGALVHEVMRMRWTSPALAADSGTPVEAAVQ